MNDITEQDIDEMVEMEIEREEIESRKTPQEKIMDLLLLEKQILERMSASIDRYLKEDQRIKESN